MKRTGYLHEKICTAENIELADKNARKRKSKKYGVKKHDKHKESDNKKLLEQLTNLTYKTSEYTTFKVYEPKERLVFRLPYYPDGIAHHAMLNVIKPTWLKTFIQHTYSCIKGRGIHKLANDLRKILDKDKEGTKYCLKLDVKKYYPSINHDILKQIIRKKIKDPKFLLLMDELIDSVDGVPIGGLPSQYFANLYLTYFDHFIYEKVKPKLTQKGFTLYYLRYADDMVFLSNDKESLFKILKIVRLYLHKYLKLELKSNYQVFPVDSRGVDFVGYRFFHTHTLLRKRMKIRIFRLINKFKSNKITFEDFKKKFNSYFGWLKYCNSKHLLLKIEKETGLHFSNWNGINANISSFYGKRIKVVEVISHPKYFEIHFTYKHKSFTVRSRDGKLYEYLLDLKFPLKFKLKCLNQKESNLT